MLDARRKGVNLKFSNFYDKLDFVAKTIKWFIIFSTSKSSSQIWLNHLLDGCHYSYITTDCHFDLYKGFLMEKINPNSPNFENNNFKLSYFYDKLQQVAKNTKLTTLQNFIYKNTINLENIQMHKEKKKGRIYKMSSLLILNVKISPCQQLTAYNRSVVTMGVCLEG